MPQPNTAPAARAPVPITPKQAQQAMPAVPSIAANQGTVPMEHMLKTAEVYLADIPNDVDYGLRRLDASQADQGPM